MARAPFDPSDEFDAMAESFRRQVAVMLLDAQDAAIFRDMPVERQIESFMAGVLTGLIGSCFACISEEGRDAIMEYMVLYMPIARENAEGVR